MNLYPAQISEQLLSYLLLRDFNSKEWELAKQRALESVWNGPNSDDFQGEFL